MKIYRYTKAEMQRAADQNLEVVMDTAVNQLLEDHCKLSHRVADVDTWVENVIRVLIWDNSDWPLNTRIADEVDTFLKAVRNVEVELKGMSPLAYIQCYKDWRKAQQRFNQPTPATPDAFVSRGLAKHDATDYDHPQRWGLTMQDCYDGVNEQRRCITDCLEGFERFWFNEARIQRFVAYDTARRKGLSVVVPDEERPVFEHYRKACEIYKILAGREWERFSSGVANEPAGMWNARYNRAAFEISKQTRRAAG